LGSAPDIDLLWRNQELRRLAKPFRMGLLVAVAGTNP